MQVYLIKYLSLTGMTLLLISGFILLVDPLNIFRLAKIEGFNKLKPYRFNGGMRETKSIDIESGGFDTLILGTSRTNQGIKTSHAFFDGKRPYHAALDGANFYEIYQVFEFAAKHNDIKMVVLGLDFSTFANDKTVIDSFYESRFAGKNILISNFSDLFSPLMLMRSINTVKENLYMNDDANLVGDDADEEENFTKRFQGINLVQPLGQDFQYNSPERLNLLENLIGKAIKNDIKLYLFISPVHARDLEDLRLSGLYPLFEQWKRELVNITAKITAKYPDEEEVKIWDFSGYNSITTEEFYEKWYKDRTHYKRILGDMVLEVMSSHPHRPDGAPMDFGTVININNVEEHLQVIRQSQHCYHQRFEQEIRELEQSVGKVRSQ
jgi:hypothetical protein